MELPLDTSALPRVLHAWSGPGKKPIRALDSALASIAALSQRSRLAGSRFSGDRFVADFCLLRLAEHERPTWWYWPSVHPLENGGRGRNMHAHASNATKNFEHSPQHDEPIWCRQSVICSG
jgi:hypothetical protein